MKISTALLVLSLVTWFPARAATAYTITLNGLGTSYLLTTAEDKSGENAQETLYPASLPYVSGSSVVDGLASADSGYNLSNEGFFITFDHERPPAPTYSYGETFGQIYFSLDQNVQYVASGSYSALDSDGRMLRFGAYLYDLTLDSTVFESLQRSSSTPNESFTLGLVEGDELNTSIGSLTGMLIADNEYVFVPQAYIETLWTTSSSGATASGNVALAFAPIPEPTTASLLGLGLVGIAAVRRRRANLKRGFPKPVAPFFSNLFPVPSWRG